MTDAEPPASAEPPPTPTSSPPPDQSRSVDVKRALEIAGLVAAPLSVVTSALVYFGIVRTQVEADFYGIDPDLFGYSYDDHVVRSVAPMLGPLAVGGLVAVLLVVSGRALGEHRSTIAASDAWRWAASAATVGGVVLIAAGALVQVVRGSRHGYISPLLLATGAIAVLAGAAIHTTVAAGGAATRTTVPAGMKLATAFVLTFATFTFVARLAQSEGFDRARDSVRNLNDRAQVWLVSEDVLGIDANGTACYPIAESRFTRRYGGLSLVAHRNGRYLLVPISYQANDARLLVIEESPAIRLEADATPRFRAARGEPDLPPLPRVAGLAC